MNAAETIAAAIEKLEGLKGSATPGFIPDGFARVEIVCEDAGTIHVVEPKNEADIDLAATLHHTIDAQLAILRTGMRLVTAFPDSEWTNTVNLARAILGEAS
jgi:hypothetical protein